MQNKKRALGRLFCTALLTVTVMAPADVLAQAAEAGQAEAGQAEAGQAEAGQTEVSQAEAGQTEVSHAKAGQTGVVIEYGNLRELLKSGNPDLKRSYDDYERNVADYQEMWDVMKRAQGNLEDKAEAAEESGGQDQALYTSNASMLKNSASRIYKQLQNMTSTKSTRSLEKSADSYTLAAQTIMNSYLQMAGTVKARSKSVEALTAVCQETARKQSVGSATQSDVLAARNQLDQATNSLQTLEEQTLQLKRRLFTMLGLGEESSAVIGPVPEPDLAAIEAIDYEADREKAIGNNQDVQTARHSQAGGTAGYNRRFKQVDEAEGTAEAGFLAAYQELLVKKTEYQAAAADYDSALISYQSLERRRQVGLLGNAEYLQGEAEYLEQKAAWESAAMNLVQAYENYQWEVKGVS